MAHADVTLDVERRAAREAERLHVGVHLRLEHAVLGERPLERTDELLVHRTPGGRHAQRWYVIPPTNLCMALSSATVCSRTGREVFCDNSSAVSM